MARMTRARTSSAEVERVRALLETMQHTHAGASPEAPEPPATDAGRAVTAWATLSEAAPASTFEAHSRRTSGAIVCEPATPQEAAACETDPHAPSEALSAVAAFLEALGTPVPDSRPDARHAGDSDEAHARPTHRETSVPVSVAKAFGQERRTFATPEAFDEALARCMEDCAWKRLLSMAGARERSAAHVERALRDEGFPREVARSATRRARACQLVDDARFAETLIRAKLRAGWGRQRIERALAQEGVDPSCVPGYPEEFFAEDGEEQRAWQALLRKPVPERNPEQKLARFLVGRGFSPGLALRLARRRVEQERGEE